MSRDDMPIPFTVKDRETIVSISIKMDGFIAAANKGFPRCHQHHSDIETLKTTRKRWYTVLVTVAGSTIVTGIGALIHFLIG